MERPPSEFLDLDRTDRADWVVAFCARKEPQPPGSGPTFPSLVAGQSAYDWLVLQFQLLTGKSGLRQRLRDTVVELVRTRAGRADPSDRTQVLGLMLCVARELEFVEIAPDLEDWVRSGWLRPNLQYRLGGENVPLQRTVWSLLIGWSRLDNLQPQLTRDLTRLAMSEEEGTAQLCFVALGQRDVAEALRLIPLTVGWPEAYWLRAMTQFFRTVGAAELLREEYRQSWSTCLGACFYDPELETKVRRTYEFQWAEFDTRRQNRLWEALIEVAITVRLQHTSACLEGPGGLRLIVDLTAYTEDIRSSAHANATLGEGASLTAFAD